ncbi:MAG: VWA domain-containing protein [Mycobacteriaceae bacterium]
MQETSSRVAAAAVRQHGLAEHTARVALCLDISGSMHRRYGDGSVAALAEKVLALAGALDPDRQVEVFLFGERGHHPGTLTAANHADFLATAIARFPLENATDYGAAMTLLRRHYFGSDQPRRTPLVAEPVFVVFVTDGQTADEDGAREQVISASYEPVFWQFVGIGRSTRAVTPGSLARSPSPGVTARRRVSASIPACGGSGSSEFGFLEELDTIGDRCEDNTDFFTVTDPTALPDVELFEQLLSAYPAWRTRAQHRTLLH